MQQYHANKKLGTSQTAKTDKNWYLNHFKATLGITIILTQNFVLFKWLSHTGICSVFLKKKQIFIRSISSQRIRTSCFKDVLIRQAKSSTVTENCATQTSTHNTAWYIRLNCCYQDLKRLKNRMVCRHAALELSNSNRFITEQTVCVNIYAPMKTGLKHHKLALDCFLNFTHC